MNGCITFSRYWTIWWQTRWELQDSNRTSDITKLFCRGLAKTIWMILQTPWWAMTWNQQLAHQSAPKLSKTKSEVIINWPWLTRVKLSQQQCAFQVDYNYVSFHVHTSLDCFEGNQPPEHVTTDFLGQLWKETVEQNLVPKLERLEHWSSLVFS